MAASLVVQRAKVRNPPDVLCGVNSVVLYYTNQKGTRTAEFMELSAKGKLVRVVANYGA